MKAVEECKGVFGIERVAVLSNSAGSSDDVPGYEDASRLELSLGIPVIRHGSKVHTLILLQYNGRIRNRIVGSTLWIILRGCAPSRSCSLAIVC